MTLVKPAILLFTFTCGRYAVSDDVAKNDPLAKITYQVLGMMKAKSGAT